MLVCRHVTVDPTNSNDSTSVVNHTSYDTAIASLVPGAMAFGAFYALIGILHVTLRPRESWAMATVSGSAALMTFVIALVFRARAARGQADGNSFHRAAAAVVLVALVATHANTFMMNVPPRTMHVSAVVLVTGIWLLSFRWWAVCVIVAIGGWLWIAMQPPGRDWSAFAPVLFGSTIASAAAMVIRTRGHRKYIIDQARSNRALRESQASLERAQRIAMLGSWEWDLTNDQVVWSDEMYRLFGYEPDCEKDTSEIFRESLHPDDRDRVYAFADRMKKERKADSIEYRIIRRDGEQRVIWGEIEYIYDESGRAIREIGTDQDITDRKLAQEIQRTTEERYRAAAEGSLDSFYLLECARDEKGAVVDFYFLDVNQRGADMINMTRDQIVGQRLCELLPINRTGGFFEKYVNVYETGQVLEEEFPIESPDFDELWFHHQVVPLANGVAITSRDITKRRKNEAKLRTSEARLRDVIEDIDGIVWECEADTLQFTYVSPYAEKMLGYAVEEWYENPNLWLESIHPSDRDQALSYCRKRTESGHDHSFDYRAITADGRTLWVHDIVSLVRDATGNVTHLRGIMVNITEMRRAEQVIRENDERFHLVSLATKDAIYDWNIIDGTVWRNDTYHQLYRLPSDGDADEHEWERHLDPDDRQRVVDSLHKVIDGDGHVWHCEYRIKRQDGDYRDVDDRGYIMRDASGVALRVIGAMTDITERKRADMFRAGRNRVLEALAQGRELNEVLHLLATTIEEQLHETLCSIQLIDDGRLNFVAHPRLPNGFAAALTGREIGPASGAWGIAAFERRCVTVRDFANSPLMAQVRDLVAPYALVSCVAQPVFAGNRRAIGVFTIFRDAPWQPPDDQIQILESASQLAGLVIERRRAEEALRESESRFRSVAECLGEGLIITDLEDSILYANSRITELTGFEPDEMLCRRAFELLLMDEDWQALQKRLEDRRDGTLESYEIRLKRKDGQLFWAEINAAPFTDSDGRIIGTLGAITDISARKQSEDALRQSQKLEAVGTLATGVAHDINNLLTAISGYADFAREALPEGHEASHPLEMIDQATDQAGSVTKSLLMFARRSISEKLPVNLAAITAESLRMLRSLMPASIELIERTCSDQHIWVTGDKPQLQQVMMNLALNARDAMQRGGQLEVTIDIDNDDAVIRFIDNGCGIEKENLDRIFEPFFTTKPRGQGTGLGLAVVHGIVAEHNGRIEIDSVMREGTTCAVYLPRCPTPDTAENAPVVRNGSLAGDGQTVLLAEDNSYVRMLMKDSLHDAGYKVIEAADGEIAAERFLANHEDLQMVILDLDLPKRSGMSCLEEIRIVESQLPVVIVTGNAEQLPDDFNDPHTCVMLKPFRMAELLDVTSNLQRVAAPTPGVEADG